MNGVDLRGKTSRDEEDYLMRTVNVSRLERGDRRASSRATTSICGSTTAASIAT